MANEYGIDVAYFKLELGRLSKSLNNRERARGKGVGEWHI